MKQELTKATLVKTGLTIGIKKGWRGVLWMMIAAPWLIPGIE